MKILQTMRFDHKLYTVDDVRIEPPFPNNVSEHCRFGIDPGTTKMGLAYLWRTICHVYEVKIIRSPDAVARMLLTQDILSECFRMFDYAPLMTIEGSSFGNNYRQTELAEVRTAAVLWAINHAITPIVIPPLKIRKNVFGNGKMKAEDVWTELPPDAASALACAYFSVIE